MLRIWNQSISDQRESDKIVRALVALYTMPTPGQDGNWKKKAIRLLYKGKTVEQVAKRLKKSRQAVYDELKRAKNHIQKTMETKDLDGMSEFSIEKIYRGPKLKRKRRKGVKYEKRKG